MNIFNKSHAQFYLYNRAHLWKWVNTHGSYGVVLFRLSKYVVEPLGLCLFLLTPWAVQVDFYLKHNL